MFETKLHMTSIGIVAEDRQINSNVIKVYPIELLPTLDGELFPIESPIESTGVDLNNNKYSVSLNLANFIEADWFRMSTNRETSPDVVRGEQVILWRYADAEEYYWTSMGRDDNLRKLETVVYTFSDIPANSGEITKGQNNQYTVEVSTHGKHMTVKTCKNDKEPFAYTLQINAKDGSVFLTDDVGNTISLDSKNTNIKTINRNGTLIQLNKSDIEISAPNNIDIKAGSNYNLKAGGSITVVSGDSTSIKAGTTVSVESGSKMSMKAGTAASVESKTQTTIKAGSVVSMMAAGISMVSGGVARSGGGMNFVGNLDVQGTATFSNSVTAVSVNADTVTAVKMTAGDFYGNFHGTLFGGIA